MLKPKKIQGGSMRTLFLAGLMAFAAATAARAQDITDAQIRDVVTRVARHQLIPQADGDYAPVSSLEQAQGARAPSGIAWFYPQGVMLYGMARSTDVTKDGDVGRFVTQHNQIAARYYHWLAQVQQQFGDGAKGFLDKTVLRQLMAMGTMDSCGAMGNAMMEDMMRHPESVTVEEREVLARIADWIVNKQARMPDGTLWRPARDNTVWPDDLYMGG